MVVLRKFYEVNSKQQNNLKFLRNLMIFYDFNDFYELLWSIKHNSPESLRYNKRSENSALCLCRFLRRNQIVFHPVGTNFLATKCIRLKRLTNVIIANYTRRLSLFRNYEYRNEDFYFTTKNNKKKTNGCRRKI